MEGARCDRCGGQNISNDLCLICGAYCAPVETMRFVRECKAGDIAKFWPAAKKAAYEANGGVVPVTREQHWKRKHDPEERAKYLAYQREYGRIWREARRAERERTKHVAGE